MTTPNTLWILCPNLWGARLFRCGGPELAADELKFIREFPRPGIQTKLEDFPDDEDIAELTPPPEDPGIERRVAKKYMNYLARELEHACNHQRFDSLIICAEPHLLSILLDDLGPAAQGRLVGTVDLDLYETNESDLLPYVAEFVPKPSIREIA